MSRVNLLSRLKYFRKKDSNVFYWVRDYSGFYKDNIIDFPHSTEYVELRKKAQSRLNNYFDKVTSKYKIDKILSKYVQKTISPNFIDYYIYRVQVDRIKNEKSLVIFDNLYERVLNDDHHSIYDTIAFFESFVKFMAYSFKALLTTIFFHDSRKVEDIVYIRKQEKPDVFNFDEFDFHLSKYQKKMSKVYPLIRDRKNQYGVYYINAFQGSFFILCRAFLLTATLGFRDLLKLYESRLLIHLDGVFLQHVFSMGMLVEMNAKIYFGMLADKAIYNLLYKYKKDHQKLAIYLDGVNFNGNIIILDLFYSDICLFSDQYVNEGVNKNGGSCHNIDLVGSFVTSTNAAAGDISDDLKRLVIKYKTVVMVASAQAYGDGLKYDYLGINYLSNFLYTLKRISDKYHDILFILKEKKGEFNNFDLDIFSNNVFIVRTKDPKKMRKNHFDHILSISDIVVSVAPNSTVILQAINSNKLPLIYNQYNQKTIWKQYGNIEMDLESFEYTIDYWINNLDASANIIRRIKQDFILDKNFYQESAKKICSIL